MPDTDWSKPDAYEVEVREAARGCHDIPCKAMQLIGKEATRIHHLDAVLGRQRIERPEALKEGVKLTCEADRIGHIDLSVIDDFTGTIKLTLSATRN